jgi:glycine cleavage system aminomethyltransferase T
MVTNDVRGLAVGSGCYCFVLDAQGHIQADCNVYMEADRLIVDCEAFVTAKLMALFDRPSALRLLREPLGVALIARLLLVPQRDYRVHAPRATRRDPAGA